MNNPEIKIVRLRTGEDIVAGYTTDSTNTVLDNPMHLIFKRTDSGTAMLLVPWLPIELIKTNSAKILTKEILTIIEPLEAFVTYYNHISRYHEMSMLEESEEITQMKESLEAADDEDDLISDGSEPYDEEYSTEDISLTRDDAIEVIVRKKMNLLH
jgi:uncharacterized protein YacL (UPF0231 family)